MKGLIVDTSINKAYAAAFDGDNISVSFLASGVSTASAIQPAAEKALSDLGLRKEELDGVSAVVGPGSFTGIRIGVSFINAFAFALGIPRFRFTAFDVLREAVPNAPAYAVDAGHQSAYASLSEPDGSFSDENVPLAELPEGTVFQAQVEEKLPQAALALLSRAIDQHVYALCAPSYLTDLLRPYYMRKSQAERMKEQGNV